MGSAVVAVVVVAVADQKGIRRLMSDDGWACESHAAGAGALLISGTDRQAAPLARMAETVAGSVLMGARDGGHGLVVDCRCFSRRVFFAFDHRRLLCAERSVLLNNQLPFRRDSYFSHPDVSIRFLYTGTLQGGLKGDPAVRVSLSGLENMEGFALFFPSARDESMVG